MPEGIKETIGALRSRWSGRRVCVTGGAGFIGGHLVETLVELGASVAVLDDLSNSDGELVRGFVERAPDRVDFIHGSILDPVAVRDAVEGCSHVMHLAAISSVVESVEDPQRCVAVNAMGTARIANACSYFGVERLIYAASSSAYGENEPPHDESAAPCALSPYAAGKLAGEHIVQAWARSKGLPGISLRLFNVFGPRQPADSPYSAVVPIFVQRLSAGEPLTIHGDGEQSRDFVHVCNVVYAFLLAGEAPAEALGQVVNVGAGRAVSILELARRLAQALDGPEPVFEHAPPRPGDVRFSWADLARARELLGFEPLVDLDEGLRDLVTDASRDDLHRLCG